MPRLPRIHSLRCLPFTVALLATSILGSISTRAAEYLSSADPALAQLPFSEAVQTDGLLILSGQIPNIPGTLEVVDGGIKEQSHQVMKNIQTILERHGSSLEKVVKCTVMIDDMADWPAFNEVYVQYFPGPKPARSAFGADGLAMGALIEVEMLGRALTPGALRCGEQIYYQP